MAKYSLTVKNVDDRGNSHYAEACYVGMVCPTDGRPNYLVMDCGDDDGVKREIRNGFVYIMNSAGKTIDAFSVGKDVAPVTQAG